MKQLTQEQKVLKYLKTHKRGTNVREIFTLLHVNSPTKVISDLRSNGHKIESTRVDVYDDNGRIQSYYHQYTLKEEKK